MDQSKPDRPDHHVTPGPLPAPTPASLNGDAAPSPADHVPATPPEEALTPRAWLMQNGVFVAFILALVGFAYARLGPEWLLSAFKVAVGLGFVIFIHELGHFLAAKWCDVHVLTFSIGFGPAIPGCHFQRGETTYKVALLPLGGYVNMVGEGPEADEEEDYPRSFKNKTVGQRMLIISAGVIMNILFGLLCFVVVYRYHGVERPPAVVWSVEPGSRAWEKGVHAGWKIKQIGDKVDPWFDDMRIKVALSSAGVEIPFEFVDRQGKEHARGLEPFRDENGMIPVIGVRPPQTTRLYPERGRRYRALPVDYQSAAAHARVLSLRAADRVVSSTSPLQGGEVTSLRTPVQRAAAAVGLSAGPAGALASAVMAATMADGPALAPLDWQELAYRMRLAGARVSMLVGVLRDGKDGALDRVTMPAEGFEFDDRVIATSAVPTGGAPYRPFDLRPLPPDPTHPDGQSSDPFVFRERLEALAGLPMVMRVQREGGGEVDVLVPPAYHRSLGLLMLMGRIAAVRGGSDAAAQLTKDDIKAGLRISGASLSYDGEPFWPVFDGGPIDPVRLPSELARRIQAGGRDPALWRVKLRVRGPHKHEAQAERDLAPMRWDPTFTLAEEAPMSPSSPMSIPQLGIAYWVDSTVASVRPGSPADKAGIQPNDQLQRVRFRVAEKSLDAVKWSPWLKMASRRGKEEQYDQWAHWFWTLQRSDYPELEVEVQRAGAKLAAPIQLYAVPDFSWPMADRGLVLTNDSRLLKAETFAEAAGLGLDRTWGFITQIYLNLSSLFSGRISTQTLGGPIEIASQAFSFAGEDLFVFALFLGIISINLAVVNFLPIPVLDGGHMVFLFYELVRGKRPPESVYTLATYLGLAIIASLMIFVFYLDISRRVSGWF